ncbi:MAG: YbbR-like domain-containing protein [Candidatus Pedobacter colombiensis]|uniref:YbbR-like domain-containing protein n=1 Tax=Candidatus Pedobacter colombiensis TaxID=3121371 RepID=A0AAJ6B7R6_9SPHI|nr:YbbR-like domain-containing protein [Pedobacter sp.]WEK20580.1 MAG: YbbR-like domain-containing protein [Pedobacter sp.]
MPFIRLTKIERKRFLVFITCLLLAIAAWLFMALNDKYPYTVKTVLKYNNIPQKKAFHPLQSDTVDLQVEGTGWQLLFSRLRIKPQSIAISLEKLNNRNFILFSEQLINVNRQLETSQKIKSVKPDTLYFDFSPKTVKRVPVKLVSDINFVKQYGIFSHIEITPSYVTISGPEQELEKINQWKTDSLNFDDVQSTIKGMVAMTQSKMKNVSIFPASVEVKVPVDEFTEKVLEVPLKIINNNEYYNVKLYPKKVKVTFLVALSKYNQVSEDFIEAVVDMNEWKNLKHNRLRVRVVRFPDFCKLVQVAPGKVDFIIEK